VVVGGAAQAPGLFNGPGGGVIQDRCDCARVLYSISLSLSLSLSLSPLASTRKDRQPPATTGNHRQPPETTRNHPHRQAKVGDLPLLEPSSFAPRKFAPYIREQPLKYWRSFESWAAGNETPGKHCSSKAWPGNFHRIATYIILPSGEGGRGSRRRGHARYP
jgi:hypothetical protein